ncbi:YSC84-related protein [Paraburkholderia silvatlantica]|uniref:Las17-binding protein actin regulator n=1 Tax=Paraburkholderia silvatlantica TaxID=321895 RepID=A0A2U0ZWK8_9BURK|nr:YSC84-related protein [Paraburkholderia silvatlantica]MBB2932300.1 lipid-binding SYLF domain-containing protein [Paraburkholderia silvatlantica]PVY23333.1 Las17-binding protein actin regulator [Paraburkholderia silvatlantica]PXW29892.1 Las17-binding protein actin regulator [Paraburkholderia silvatlantica]PYE21507.1 Las17-binding protein actin regulator [Paraburkholderia silvatlantica]
MLKRLISTLLILLMLPISAAWADEYADALSLFKNAGESGSLLHSAYGYALFPKIGKGGVGIGGAHGKGRVYEQGKHIGDASMTQVTVGLQLGGQVYSELILFEDERALKEFTNGNFEFGADANAIAITAAAGAQAGTTGTSANVSAGKKDAKTAGGYRKGVAVFTVAKGGLMYEASVGGQKFSYKPR